jgi:hypothetical protein
MRRERERYHAAAEAMSAETKSPDGLSLAHSDNQHRPPHEVRHAGQIISLIDQRANLSGCARAGKADKSSTEPHLNRAATQRGRRAESQVRRKHRAVVAAYRHVVPAAAHECGPWINEKIAFRKMSQCPQSSARLRR